MQHITTDRADYTKKTGSPPLFCPRGPCGPRLKFFACTVLLLATLSAPAFAQTAAKLDIILETERVSFGQAALIVLPAAGLLPPDAGEAEAFAKAGPWLPRRAERNIPIKLGELSRLVMGAFDLSGGFMYALFPGPRYACRAMAWRRLLPPGADPGSFLNGEELLYVTGRTLVFAGEEQLPFEEDF
jgi:hypothetical protein